MMANQQQRFVHRCFMWGTRLLLMSASWMITTPTNALSGGFSSPDECLAYTQDAHLNCLYAYIEIQQDKIVQLKAALNEEQRTSQRLQDDVTHQLSLNDMLQQRINDDREAFDAYRYPRIRMYSGFSYNFGRPRYYRRFFQPHIGFHIGPYDPDW